MNRELELQREHGSSAVIDPIALLLEARDVLLEILSTSDQAPSDECKKRARTFLKEIDKKVINDRPQGPQIS